METGGVGKKVRTVVSCKGSNCRFGLYDTQAFATDIHNEIYVSMENEVLLHKFKIALGGCPNNCVKPDLNDSLLKTNLNKKIGQQMSFRIEGQHLFAFMETKIENLIIKKKLKI